MELNSGERQVAPTVDGIRRDHVARYEWAAKSIAKGSRVIDFACGIGYGCKIMADAGHFASGFDRSAEALAYAAQHYASPKSPGAPYARFAQADGNDPKGLGKNDAAVCFETIEHIEDPRQLLRALHESAPLLFASVPNEAVMPWRRESDGATTAFHFRHYTKAEFAALLDECGWTPVEWYGQEDHESEVEPDVNGRTLIAICKRTEVPVKEDDGGKHIAILGLGPSIDQYLDYTKRLGGRSAFCDEVWAINALGNVLDCDLVFHMDDIRVQERRAEAAPDSNIAAMVRWIKHSKVPVVTSRKHPDYPALVEFPLEDVLNHLQHDYFNSTAAYAVAMAIHIGATKISCFGFDFTYANSHQAEKGRACVEFWLGVAKARGIKLSMPKTTTLMDAMGERKDRLYGYDTVDVVFDMQEDGSVKLQFKPLDEIPTAAEMERRYDHSRPVNALVEAAMSNPVGARASER